MKGYLIEHLKMVFQVLQINSQVDVYDCTIDELPQWAIHLPQLSQYFICTPITNKMEQISKFIGKKIEICGDMMYWYDGEPIKSNSINSIESSDNLCNYKNNKTLKTSTRLPYWLDDYIFNCLNAEYSPDYSKFDCNLKLKKSDILKYLGTYFPRSYSESFCIFDNLFYNKGFNGAFIKSSIINILAIGCGTGGDLMGLLTVIEKFSQEEKAINIIALDGNHDSLKILKKIIDRFAEFYKAKISLKIIEYTFEDISNFNLDIIGVKQKFDFILNSKMICEIIAMGNISSANSYFDYVKKFLPLLSDKGVFYLLDVTTRQLHSTFNPILMNVQVQNVMHEMMNYQIISPIPCSIFNTSCAQNCFYQKTFFVTHSKMSNDKSKVAYKLIASKSLASKIGMSLMEKDQYKINDDTVCPNTNSWNSIYRDAFYIPDN